MVSTAFFRRVVYGYYKKNRRDMPWRRTHDPYRILVSEIMLQQTQVSRVTEKYREFIRAFPTIRSLARAPLQEILRVWQGLGYNRRALLLQKLARIVVSQYEGRVPDERAALRGLPGIGDATAGALCAFAFDQPVAFIETNIRAAYIHHFFRNRTKVSDGELMPLAARTIDAAHPREWYYALMDYGSYLKRVSANPARRSSHYAKQARFEGSDRQVRGRILKMLLSASPATVRDLCAFTGADRARCNRIMTGLCKDGLIKRRGAVCMIA